MTAQGPREPATTKKFSFDPSLSWGDVGMFVAAVGVSVSFLWGFQRQILVHAERMSAQERHIERVDVDLRQHKSESVASDAAIRADIKSELRDINSKLDRIVERELSLPRK
jgi:hypothetical protein